MLQKRLGRVCAVVGGQWGDEGKGKLIDVLAREYDIIVRATGGANAGHTIYHKHEKFVFHLVPSGMFHSKKIGVMGNGMVVHFPTLLEEIELLEKHGVKIKNRLFLSDRAHIVFDYHKVIDQLQEKWKGGKRVGTTGRGIGPAYTDKISRIGIRVSELLDFDSFLLRYTDNLASLQRMYDFPYDPNPELKFLRSIQERLSPLVINTAAFLHHELEEKKTILLEGANGTLLDIDHGTYPYVTSSNAAIGGIISGSGISPLALKSIIGTFKAYATRVGSGVFPTEQNNEIGEKLREIGREFGATTGRPRRCGWFDAVSARYSVSVNGFTGVNLTKLDVLNSFSKIKIGVGYRISGKLIKEMPASLSILEKAKIDYIEMPGWETDISKAHTFHSLPKNCQRYVEKIESLIGCKIQFIGIGVHRGEMILR